MGGRPRCSCDHPHALADQDVLDHDVLDHDVLDHDVLDQDVLDPDDGEVPASCPGEVLSSGRTRVGTDSRPAPEPSPRTPAAAAVKELRTSRGETSGRLLRKAATAPAVTAVAWLVPEPRHRPPTRAPG